MEIATFDYGRSTDLKKHGDLSSLRRLLLQIDHQSPDFSPLATLTSLEYLTIEPSRWVGSTMEINDLSPLASLSNLKTLTIVGEGQPTEDSDLIDVSPIGEIPTLEEFTLFEFRRLKSLRGLERLRKLKKLELVRCSSIYDLEALTHIQSLTEVCLHGCRFLEDLTPLANLQNLVELDLRGCDSLSDLRPLGKLKRLRSLDLSDCKSLSDLGPLEKIGTLRKLNVEGSKIAIRNFEPFPDLPKLVVVGGIDPNLGNGKPMFKGEIVPFDQESTKVGIVSLERNCGVKECSEKVQRLITIPAREIGRESEKTYFVDRCLNCFFDSGAVSFQYNDKDEIIWSDDDSGECMDFLDEGERTSKASIKWTPLIPNDFLDFDTKEGLRAGGPIIYVHGCGDEEESLSCPKCDQEMEFIARFPSGSMDYYRNRKWKGSELEDFKISIEHYATLFFFRCESCNVSTTFTQCT